MPYIYNMNRVIDRPINRTIDVVDNLLIVLSNIILNIDDYQGFVLHTVSSRRVD